VLHEQTHFVLVARTERRADADHFAELEGGAEDAVVVDARCRQKMEAD
jgi:hypothetical protein